MLTDLKVRNAKPRDRDYRLTDSGGLYLYVTTKGYRSWRMKYRFAGKEKRLTFGPYPEVSLSEARERRDAARKQLRDHRDPATEELKRKLSAAADHKETFEFCCASLAQNASAALDAGTRRRCLEKP